MVKLATSGRNYIPTGVTRGRKPESIKKRLGRYTSVDDSTGCWNWTGAVSPKGYGRMQIGGQKHRGGRLLFAHVVSYLEHKGEYPEGTETDHLCFNRACINPDHLEAVTHEENLRRRRAKAAG